MPPIDRVRNLLRVELALLVSAPASSDFPPWLKGEEAVEGPPRWILG
jgi:hypothetical protein